VPKRKVYIDGYGRTIVNGKAFFPLGLYSSRRDVAELDTYCEGPFNCILPYALKPEAGELDAYGKKGLKVIVCVSDYSGFRGSKLKGAEDERAYAMRYLEAFKDHPSLLAWYLADELPEAKIGCLRSRNLLFRARDPDHPTFVVFDRVDSPADFVEGYDIVGMDPYPIGNTGLRSNLDSASLFPEAAKKAMHSFRGLWQVPQAFDWTWHRPWAAKESGAHMPTLAELLLARAVIRLTATVASMLACDGEAKLLGEMASLYGYLAAAASICAVVFMIALTLLIHSGTALS
jgi:hypothetical protein